MKKAVKYIGCYLYLTCDQGPHLARRPFLKCICWCRLCQLMAPSLLSFTQPCTIKNRLCSHLLQLFHLMDKQTSNRNCFKYHRSQISSTKHVYVRPSSFSNTHTRDSRKQIHGPNASLWQSTLLQEPHSQGLWQQTMLSHYCHHRCQPSSNQTLHQRVAYLKLHIFIT